MATRAKIDVANLIHTDEEWAASIEKPGLKVVDVYAQWAGPCEAIQTIFKTIKMEHGDNISFLQVSADSIEALSKYRGKSCPTFMFFFDDILVKIITGANSPLIEKTIKEQLDLQANGQIHVPLILDIESALGNSAQKQVAPAEGISTSPSSELRKSGTTRTNDPAVDGAIEYTLGFIKPDAMHPSIIGQILDVIKRNRIEVVKKKKVWLSKEQAEEFYKEHKGVDWFPNLVRFVSSAPILVLELAKENAVQAWRQVIGPTSTKRAREENPKCIRALFGTDNLMNAVFGSSSPESAKFELDFFFHSNSSSPSPMLEIPFTDIDTESRGTSLQKTLLFLKPDVVGVQGSGGGEAPSGNSKTVEEIVEIILWRGYQIIKREDFVITQETAVELFEMYGEEVWYDELIDFVCSAPTLAFVLKGENVIKGIYELAGPMNPEEAREKFPMSLRARYGTSIVQNAVHCPSTVEDAIRDVQILFPHISLSRHGSQLLSRFGLESTSVRGSKANIISSLRGSLRSINALNSRAISPAQGLAERTLVIVKSDAYIEEEKEVEVDNGASLEKQTRRHKLDSILAAVSKAGFKVVDAKEVQLEDSVAREFYKGHEDEANFEGLISSITRGPIYVAVLEKNSAINSWKELIGPNNPTMAKENAPSSLRAKFGTDDANNGLHGSDSPADAEREIKLFFGDSVSPFADGYKPEVAPRAGLISHTASYHSLNNVKPIPIIPEEIPAPAAITAALESSMAAAKVEPEEEIQRTLALIKPDAYGAGKKDEIVAIIKSSGFTIVKEAEVKWDLETAKKFYKEHEGKSFYNDLTTWMSSAPIYTLVLEKAGAIKAWRALAGPTNSLKAKEEAPNSIRALFGTDGTYNAVHGSDSPESAEREIQIVSTEQVPVVEETAVPVPAANVEAVVEVEGPVQQTLALIKPDAYGAGKKDEIIEKIKQRGFTIIQEKELQLSVNDAKEFYKEHEGKGFYEELTTWMSSAPIYAMVLEKVNGISAWRELAGPTNSNTARESAPESIRALYGKDGSENAVHGSDSVESAAREIAIIFKAAPAAEEKIPTRPPSKPSSRPESPNKSRRTSAVATGETAPIGSSRISVRSKVPSKPTISRTASQAGSIRPVLSKPASQASITKTASQAAVSKTPSQASMKPPLSKPASKATIPKPASGLGSKAPSRMSSKAELGKTPSQANVVKSAAGSKPVSRTQSQNL